MRETLTAFDQMILDTLKLLNSIANKIILNNSVSVFQDVNKQSYICTEASHSPQILLYLKKKKSQNDCGWKGDMIWWSTTSSPCAKAGSPCTGFCSGSFWISLEKEIPQPAPCSSTLTLSQYECFFLTFRWNFLCFSLCPVPLIVLLDTTEKSDPIVTLRYLYAQKKSHLSCLFFTFNRPFAFFITERCYSPLIIFKALC